MEISFQTHEFIQAEAAAVYDPAQLLPRFLLADNAVQGNEQQYFILFQRHGKPLEFFPYNFFQHVAHGKNHQPFIPQGPSVYLFLQIPDTQKHGNDPAGIQFNGQDLHIPFNKCLFSPVFPAYQLQHKLPAQRLQVVLIFFDFRAYFQDLLRFMQRFQQAVGRQIIFNQIIDGIML